ncbi:MAG: citrate synthase [Candidatus Azotimanducaceae bacterium]|jgi:citrate synthase
MSAAKSNNSSGGQCAVAKGLAGVVVDSTSISDVQPTGKLSYRGVPVSDLVRRPFAEVAGMLLETNHEISPTTLSVQETDCVLQQNRTLHPMKLLQGMAPLLEVGRDLEGELQGDLLRGIGLANKLPAVLATHLIGDSVSFQASDYCRSFLTAINPSKSLSVDHHQAFNAAQILQLEHSFNAGTFTARVVASTLADIEAALSAGLGALSGALHGGADQAVLAIVDRLRTHADIIQTVDELLSQDGRMPGMGHREYRVRDPRAGFLEEWAQVLSLGTEHEKTFLKLKQLETVFRERMAQKNKPVYANVEFYKGLVYRMVGLPDHFFTACFAMSRVYGYVAHFVESRVDNRIYRPQARYVGG